MCGIAGIVDARGRPIAREPLIEMTRALSHRGPDDEGFYFNRSAEQGSTRGASTALGHRRLKVIDLGSGTQPMSNRSGSLWIVFNGEIYNYQELREELVRRGYRFRTQSDTEVILHAYDAYGLGCLEHLRGMFAFGLWDQERQRLLLARDRLGKKPLVYTLIDGQLLFASELQALTRHPAISRKVDPEAIHHYLSFGVVPAPWTAFQEIQKLPPAHYLLYENGRLSLTRYWQLDFYCKRKISGDEALEGLNKLLEESVRLRLRSDVPLGVFLSGGVDSSAVVALASRSSANPLKTFSIGFENEAFNELPYARAVAQQYATEHQEACVRPDAIRVVPQLIHHYGEPFADSSALPTYYVAQLARQSVTVALNGDGGDEAFGGYYRHLAMRLADRYLVLPEWLRNGLIRPVARLWPFPARTGPGQLSLRRFLGVADLPRPQRWLRWTGLFSETQKRSLYSAEMAGQTKGLDSGKLLDGLFNELQGLDGVDAALAVDTSFYLPNDLLVKMDIATMAHGLEARSPLLDHCLLEFMASLPANMKVRGTTLKFLLKKSQRKLLPPENLNRRKQGFAMPVSQWFKDPLKDWMRQTLLSPQARIRQFFVPERIQQIADSHTTAQAEYGHHLWALMMLELWLQQFMDRHPAAETTAAVQR